MPGRRCSYTNVVQTNINGAFKVYLTSSARAQTIPPGESLVHDFPLGRLIVFNTSLSSQVTYLNNTNYAGAGPATSGSIRR